MLAALGLAGVASARRARNSRRRGAGAGAVIPIAQQETG